MKSLMTTSNFAFTFAFIFILLTVSISNVAHGEEPMAPAPDSAASASDSSTSPHWSLTGHYSPIDLLIPSKMGAALEYRKSQEASWELEYTSGSIKVPFIIKDLGEVSESRISLMRRLGQEVRGFQFFYGVFYQNFKLHIGNAILNRITGGVYPSIDLVEISSLGATIGLGYRWLLQDKYILGLDGAAWAQPFINTKRSVPFLDVATDANDRDNVETAVRFIQYFPRFYVLKLTFGVRF